MTYTPKTTKKAEKEVLDAYRKSTTEDHSTYTGPVQVDISFFFVAPKSDKHRKGKPHTIKPDIDNLAKTVLDALNGEAWHDDSQINQLTLTKEDWLPWGGIPWGGVPYIEVRIVRSYD